MGLLQCVSTGLLLLKIGQEDDGKKLLKTAEAWVDVKIVMREKLHISG